MTTPLYIRIRGAVQGPFDLEKLQLLVRRGQLGRMHELSRDGVTWSRAADFPEIFEAAKAVAQAKLDESRKFAVAAPVAKGAAQAAAPAPNPATEGPWYYGSGGKECGPIEFPALRDLAARGEIRPETLVWTPRLTAWMPVGEISGLGLFAGKASDTSNSFGDTINVNAGSSESVVGDLADSLALAATRSRGWVLSVVIVLFLLAGLWALSGMVLLGMGIGRGEAGSAFTGLLNFATAIVLLVGAILLSNYYRHLGRVVRTRSVIAFEAALRVLHGFWVFAGVVMVLSMVMFMFLAMSSMFFAFTAGTE